METYTTSFTYPRRSRCVTHYATSFQGSTDSLTAIQQQQQATTAVAGSADADAVQKLAMAVMSLHACNISYFPAQQNQGWNFHISGEFSNVMAARALILREGLPHVRIFCFTCSNAEILIFGGMTGPCHGQSCSLRDPRHPECKAITQARSACQVG